MTPPRWLSMVSLAALLGAAAPAGAQWSDDFAASDLDGCVHALAIHEDGLVAGGSFRVTTAAGEATTIARWDGAAWHPLGDLNGVVYALEVFGGELYAGGSLFGVGGAESFGIARWTGTEWLGLGRGTDGGAVYALRAYDGSLYAGGAFLAVGQGIASPRIARWDGAAWHAMGAGADAAVRALAVYRGELLVGGDFSHAGGLDASRLARFGSAFGWAVVPNTSITGTVHALAVHQNDLIVAGSFAGVSHATTSPNVARYHGWSSTWSPFYPYGGGPGPVYALAPLGEELVAGGAFSVASGWPQDHVALAEQLPTKTRSSPWVAMDGGVDGDVRALVADGVTLYAGGCFGHAGGSVSPGVARWGAPTASVEPGTGAPPMLAARPNPSLAGPVRIALAGDAGHAAVDVLDASGRVRARVHRGPLAAGTALAWDGRDARGRAVPAGIYFVRATTLARAATIKIVRLP